jgi:hypothetical protein
MTSDAGYNEDTEEEGPLLPGPDSGWIAVAEYVDGQEYWAAGYEDIERCKKALCLLHELHGHTPDWEQLLRGLTYLADLVRLDHPLEDFGDFLELEEFLTLTHRNVWGTAHYLYIDKSLSAEERTSLLGEFAELASRLKSYEPLRERWKDM